MSRGTERNRFTHFVATPEDFFGHNTQIMPSGAIAFRYSRSLVAGPLTLLTKMHHIGRRFGGVRQRHTAGNLPTMSAYR